MRMQRPKEHLALFDNSNYGKTFGARRMIAPTQMALGMYDEALTTYAEIARRMAADTLNDDYAVILRSRAIAAHARNHYAEAYDYQTRYADLSKVLSDSLMKGKAHEYAARYHDQEQKLEIAQMNAESQRKTIIIWAAVIIILLISIFATWLLRQWRVIRRKNLVLVEQIGEAIEYKEKYESLTPGPSPMGEGSDYSYGQKTQQVTPVAPAIESDLLSLDDISDDELFRRLRHAIKREHLYLDPSWTARRSWISSSCRDIVSVLPSPRGPSSPAFPTSSVTAVWSIPATCSSRDPISVSRRLPPSQDSITRATTALTSRTATP